MLQFTHKFLFNRHSQFPMYFHIAANQAPPLPPRIPKRPGSSASVLSNFKSGGLSSSTNSLRSSPATSQIKSETAATNLDGRLQKLQAERYQKLYSSSRKNSTAMFQLMHCSTFNFFAFRQHLIKLIQDESLLTNKYYSELELISQKIRSIPLPSAEESVSLELNIFRHEI